MKKNKLDFPKIADLGISFLLLAMTILVAISVFLRYVLNIGFVWAEELVIFIFVYLTFCGAAVALNKKAHIKIDVFVEYLPVKMQKVVAIIVNFGIAVFSLIILITGLQLIKQVGYVTSAGFRIPIGYAYLAVPLSAGAMLVIVFKRIIDIWRLERKRDLR